MFAAPSHRIKCFQLQFLNRGWSLDVSGWSLGVCGWSLSVNGWGLGVSGWSLDLSGWTLCVSGWSLCVSGWSLNLSGWSLCVSGWSLCLSGWSLGVSGCGLCGLQRGTTSNVPLLSSLEAAEFPDGSGRIRSGSSSEETAPVQNINFQTASRI